MMVYYYTSITLITNKKPSKHKIDELWGNIADIFGKDLETGLSAPLTERQHKKILGIIHEKTKNKR